MRIAYITHYAALYGANRSMLDLLLELRGRGVVEPYVVLPNEGPLTERLRAERVPFAVIPFQAWMSERMYMGRLHHRPGQYLRHEHAARERATATANALPEVLRQLTEWNVQAVHVNSAAVSIAAGLKSVALFPLIWHIRELPERQYLLTIDVGRRQYGAALRKADRRIAISHAVMADILRYTGRGVDIDLVYNGVLTRADQVRYAAGSDERWKHPQPFRFVLAGLIHPSKGQEEAVRAMDIVRRTLPHVELVIAGDGKVDRLRELVTSLQLQEHVKLPGFVSDVAPLFKESHTLLMCSRNEAMGRVTVEAMASGLPVIGHASGGTLELVVDGTTGSIYPGGAEPLAQHMLTLARDPGLARSYGRNGMRVAAERFSVERMAEEVLAIYRDTIPEA